MTRTNKFWATLVMGSSLFMGVSVMFGHVPGLASGIGTVERIARLALQISDDLGNVLTGLGIILAVAVLAVLCLVGGEGSPDAGFD